MKDRKILHQLMINSRQSYTQIGKKVGLPKTVVNYRINKLIDRKIIKKFITLIDAHKLGYSILRFYFNYQYCSSEKKQEIINYMINYKYSGIVHTTEGAYELVVYMFVKNLQEFYSFWEKTLAKYRDNFST